MFTSCGVVMLGAGVEAGSYLWCKVKRKSLSPLIITVYSIALIFWTTNLATYLDAI